MTETREWLIAREAQLRADLSAVHTHTIELETALVEIRTAMRAIGLPVVVAERGRTQTMKQMTVRALTDYFKEGATASELTRYFSDAFGLNVARTSLSPQLTRLAQDGKIVCVAHKWKLAS